MLDYRKKTDVIKTDEMPPSIISLDQLINWYEQLQRVPMDARGAKYGEIIAALEERIKVVVDGFTDIKLNEKTPP